MKQKQKMLKFKEVLISTPNLFTYVRILIVPFLILFMYLDFVSYKKTYSFLAAFFFILASITDFLDGFFARKYNIKTVFGKIIDPLADKILVLSVLVFLVGMEKVSPLIVIIILAREFIVTSLRGLATFINIIIPASKEAKTKTALQMVAIILLLIDINIVNINSQTLGNILLIISVVLSVYSAIIYLINFFKIAKDLEF